MDCHKKTPNFEQVLEKHGDTFVIACTVVE